MTKPGVKIALAVAVLLVLGGIAYYLFGPQGPLALAPPPPPAASRAPVTAVPAPPPPVSVPPAPPPPQASGAVTEQAAPQKLVEDHTVPLSFAEDLANFVVDSYQPGRSYKNSQDKGVLQLSYQKVNMRYGAKPALLEQRGTVAEGRSAILTYVFKSGTINALTNLYARQFTTDLVETARAELRTFPAAGGTTSERPLTVAEVRELLDLAARMLDEGSKVFTALAENPEVAERTGAYTQSLQAVEEAYERYGKREEMPPVEAKAAGERIKAAVLHREEARTAVLAAVHDKVGHVALERDDILFLSQWAKRRMIQNEAQPQAFADIAAVLHGMAGRLRQAGEGLR